jgi:hypothetical protein
MFSCLPVLCLDYHIQPWSDDNTPLIWQKNISLRKHVVLSFGSRLSMQIPFMIPWTCVDYLPLIFLPCNTSKVGALLKVAEMRGTSAAEYLEVNMLICICSRKIHCWHLIRGRRLYYFPLVIKLLWPMSLRIGTFLGSDGLLIWKSHKHV